MLPLHQGRAVISCAQYNEIQYYNLNLISFHLCDYSTAGIGLGFYSDQMMDEDGLDAQFCWEEAAPRNVKASAPKSEGGEVRRRAGSLQESRLAVSRSYSGDAIAPFLPGIFLPGVLGEYWKKDSFLQTHAVPNSPYLNSPGTRQGLAWSRPEEASSCPNLVEAYATKLTALQLCMAPHGEPNSISNHAFACKLAGFRAMALSRVPLESQGAAL